jgi:hypothetical protein
MGVLVIVESCILGLMTGTALAQGPSAPPMWVHPIGAHACPSHSGAPVTCLISEAAVGRAQPFAVMYGGLRPFGDINNRRWDNKARERMREQELRERYRNYGYDYPPSAYGYPRFGPYYHDPDTGHYYNFSMGHYYNPKTGRHQYVNPGPGYHDANNGRWRD